MIAGALRVSTGSVRLEGRDITARSAAARARLGIGRTYQIPRPFLEMTVEENLEVAQLGSGRRQRVSVAKWPAQKSWSGAASRQSATVSRASYRCFGASVWKSRARSRSSRVCCCSMKWVPGLRVRRSRSS